MYTPQPAPTDPAQLPAFLTAELRAIANEWAQQMPFLFLQTLYAEPDRPREGMIVKADGTTWDPGSGAGIYARISSAWVKL